MESIPTNKSCSCIIFGIKALSEEEREIQTWENGGDSDTL